MSRKRKAATAEVDGKLCWCLTEGQTTWIDHYWARRSNLGQTGLPGHAAPVLLQWNLGAKRPMTIQVQTPEQGLGHGPHPDPLMMLLKSLPSVTAECSAEERRVWEQLHRPIFLDGQAHSALGYWTDLDWGTLGDMARAKFGLAELYLEMVKSGMRGTRRTHIVSCEWIRSWRTARADSLKRFRSQFGAAVAHWRHATPLFQSLPAGFRVIEASQSAAAGDNDPMQIVEAVRATMQTHHTDRLQWHEPMQALLRLPNSSETHATLLATLAESDQPGFQQPFGVARAEETRLPPTSPWDHTFAMSNWDIFFHPSQWTVRFVPFPSSSTQWPTHPIALEFWLHAALLPTLQHLQQETAGYSPPAWRPLLLPSPGEPPRNVTRSAWEAEDYCLVYRCAGRWVSWLVQPPVVEQGLLSTTRFQLPPCTHCRAVHKNCVILATGRDRLLLCAWPTPDQGEAATVPPPPSPAVATPWSGECTSQCEQDVALYAQGRIEDRACMGDLVEEEEEKRPDDRWDLLFRVPHRTRTVSDPLGLRAVSPPFVLDAAAVQPCPSSRLTMLVKRQWAEWSDAEPLQQHHPSLTRREQGNLLEWYLHMALYARTSPTATDVLAHAAKQCGSIVMEEENDDPVLLHTAMTALATHVPRCLVVSTASLPEPSSSSLSTPVPHMNGSGHGPLRNGETEDKRDPEATNEEKKIQQAPAPADTHEDKRQQAPAPVNTHKGQKSDHPPYSLWLHHWKDRALDEGEGNACALWEDGTTPWPWSTPSGLNAWCERLRTCLEQVPLTDPSQWSCWIETLQRPLLVCSTKRIAFDPIALWPLRDCDTDEEHLRILQILLWARAVRMVAHGAQRRPWIVVNRQLPRFCLDLVLDALAQRRGPVSVPEEVLSWSHSHWSPSVRAPLWIDVLTFERTVRGVGNPLLFWVCSALHQSVSPPFTASTPPPLSSPLLPRFWDLVSRLLFLPWDLARPLTLARGGMAEWLSSSATFTPWRLVEGVSREYAHHLRARLCTVLTTPDRLLTAPKPGPVAESVLRRAEEAATCMGALSSSVSASQWAEWLNQDRSSTTLVVACEESVHTWHHWFLPLSRHGVTCMWLDVRSTPTTSMAHGFYDPREPHMGSWWSMPIKKLISPMTTSSHSGKTRRRAVHVSFPPSLLLESIHRPQVLLLTWNNFLALKQATGWSQLSALVTCRHWSRILLTSPALLAQLSSLSRSFTWVLSSRVVAPRLIDASRVRLVTTLDSSEQLITHVLDRVRCIACFRQSLAEEKGMAWHVVMILCRLVPLSVLETLPYWKPWARWIREQERLGCSPLDMCNWFMSAWVSQVLHRARPVTGQERTPAPRLGRWTARAQRQWLQRRDASLARLSRPPTLHYPFPMDDDDDKKQDWAKRGSPLPRLDDSDSHLALLSGWVSPATTAGPGTAVTVDAESYARVVLARPGLANMAVTRMHDARDSTLCAATFRAREHMSSFVFRILSGRVDRRDLAQPSTTVAVTETPVRYVDAALRATKKRKRDKTKTRQKKKEAEKKTELKKREEEWDALEAFDWSWSVCPDVLFQRCVDTLPCFQDAAWLPRGAVPDFRTNWVWIWSRCENVQDLTAFLENYCDVSKCRVAKHAHRVHLLHSPVSREQEHHLSEYAPALLLTQLNADGSPVQATVPPFPRVGTVQASHLTLAIVDSVGDAQEWTADRIARTLLQWTGWSCLPTVSVYLLLGS